MPVYPRSDVRPVKGEGPYLIGEDGTRYWISHQASRSTCWGHSHPHLIAAIQRQAATLMHVSNLYGSPQGERLAQRWST
jgi:acetylornithine/N-succinyldiaminopimelate aminotransferase